MHHMMKIDRLTGQVTLSIDETMYDNNIHNLIYRGGIISIYMSIYLTIFII